MATKLTKDNFAEVAFRDEKMSSAEELAVLRFFFKNIAGGKKSIIYKTLSGFVSEISGDLKDGNVYDYADQFINLRSELIRWKYRKID